MSRKAEKDYLDMIILPDKEEQSWINCNNCFQQYSDGLSFVLTKCAHIFCSKCCKKNRDTPGKLCFCWICEKHCQYERFEEVNFVY